MNDLEQNAGARPAGAARDNAANGQQAAPSTSAKNKKKVHTIKNQSNIKKETIKLVSIANPVAAEGSIFKSTPNIFL